MLDRRLLELTQKGVNIAGPCCDYPNMEGSIDQPCPYILAKIAVEKICRKSDIPLGEPLSGYTTIRVVDIDQSELPLDRVSMWRGDYKILISNHPENEEAFELGMLKNRMRMLEIMAANCVERTIVTENNPYLDDYDPTQLHIYALDRNAITPEEGESLEPFLPKN